MKSNITKLLTLFVLIVLILSAAPVLPVDSIHAAAAPLPEGVDPTAIQRMEAGGAKTSIAPQTGGVSFLVLGEAQSLLSTATMRLLDPSAQALGFLQANRGLFGITSAGEELTLVDTNVDNLGDQHFTYVQTYQGLPVFGGVMNVHSDRLGHITAVNGLFVPQLDVNITPTIPAEAAGKTALRTVENAAAAVQKFTLMIYRDGLTQGIPGENHLAYEIEVGNGKDVRDFVYVDAHTGKILNTIEGVVSLNREVSQFNPDEPNTPTLIWKDGDPDYTGGDPEIQTLIDTGGNIYNLVKNLSGGTFLSFDGKDAKMISIADYTAIGYCPNASWNGVNIRACDGLAVDDVIAHEWGHAYTDGTHDLIYQWQPGALNEAYSDIYGEIVDFMNGAGTDKPDVVRTTSTCAINSAYMPAFKINTPDTIAGIYPIGMGIFGPPPYIGFTADIVLVDDGVLGAGNPPGTVNDGCEPFANASEVVGKIAMVERGFCNYTVKVQNAQAAGAAAVVVYNNVINGETIADMGGEPTVAITIPSVLIQRSVGLKIIEYLAGGVNASFAKYAGVEGGELVDTVRWLMGEDSSIGVLRDMWDPTCIGDPGKVSDREYYCSTADNGGVHSNSGVPNHAFALLVDGGTYNGVTVAPIGITRAAAIYWRAQKFYQTPITDFAGHADALEQSCSELIGAEIYDLNSGDPVTEVDKITVQHCSAVSDAIAAVEMRSPPVKCGFAPMLKQGTPPSCAYGLEPATAFLDTFEVANTGWTVDHDTRENVTANYRMPDWTLTDKLPAPRQGSAYFAVNNPTYGACTQEDDQTSVRSLISPEITVPHGFPFILTFEHNIATETYYDGGNVWIQVNDGEWVFVEHPHFQFNGYNRLTYQDQQGNTNPLGGLPGFSGTNGGVVTGSWVTSQVDLSAYTQPGDTIRLAFKLGQDGCNGSVGWYVDDVRLHTCSLSTYLPLMGR